MSVHRKCQNNPFPTNRISCCICEDLGVDEWCRYCLVEWVENFGDQYCKRKTRQAYVRLELLGIYDQLDFFQEIE